jgi:peroxiredoxin
MIALRNRLGMAALAVSLLWGGLACGRSKVCPEGDAGALAPDINMKTLEGKPFALQNLRGKVVLLDFWATWCAPSRSEVPDFLKLEREHRAEGFEIVAVCMDKAPLQKIRACARKWQMDYCVLADGEGKVADAYGGFQAVPSSYLLDRSGHIASMQIGLQDLAVRDAAIQALLHEPADATAN